MKQRLDWKLVAFLALVGPSMGGLAVLGVIHKSEPLLWTGAGIISAIIIGRSAATRYHAHGFVVGLLWGMLSLLTEVLFFDTYLANNPQYIEEFKTVTAVAPGVYMTMFGVATGIIPGLVLGRLSWLFRRRATR